MRTSADSSRMKAALIRTLFLLVVVGSIWMTIYMVVWTSREPVHTNCPISIQRIETGKTAFADSYAPYDCIQLEKADNADSRAAGLSNRQFMPITTGMLFVFEQPESACMWMKDMKFSLDMIWLNADQEIIKIQEHIAPETYPDTFCSHEPAAYVIEVNAGVVARAKLYIGEKLSF